MHRAVDIVDSDGKFEAVMASQPAGVPQFVLGQARLPKVCAWMSLAHVDGDEVDSVPVPSVQFDHFRPGTLSDWAGQRSEEEDQRPTTLCHGSIAEGAAVRCHEVEVRNPVARAGVSGRDAQIAEDGHWGGSVDAVLTSHRGSAFCRGQGHHQGMDE